MTSSTATPHSNIDASQFVVMRDAGEEELELLRDIDSDASRLFELAGLELDLPENHEFCMSERGRLQRALNMRTVVKAIEPLGASVGFAAVGALDGQPYLEQLSVRMGWMRRGIGIALLDRSVQIARQMAGARFLRLTTYSHLGWNRPFYQCAGFTLVAENCGPEMQRHMEYERRWLPMPRQRIAMQRPL